MCGEIIFVCFYIYTDYIAWPINNTCKINRAIVLKSIYIAPPCIQSLFNVEKLKKKTPKLSITRQYKFDHLNL